MTSKFCESPQIDNSSFEEKDPVVGRQINKAGLVKLSFVIPLRLFFLPDDSPHFLCLASTEITIERTISSLLPAPALPLRCSLFRPISRRFLLGSRQRAFAFLPTSVFVNLGNEA